MCIVCDANTLIDAASRRESVTFGWGERMDVGLEVEVQGKAAEFAPTKLRARRRFGEHLKEASEWTDWYKSGDLAGTLGQLGTDTKWEFVTPGVRAWLTGVGPFPGFRQPPAVVTKEMIAPYGYCPECGALGKRRQRRPNGDDTCMNGHTYPSASARPSPPAAPAAPAPPRPGLDVIRLRELLREAYRELSTLDAALAHPDGPDALTDLNQRIAAELGLPSAGDESV